MAIQLLETIKENIKNYPDLPAIIDVGKDNSFTYGTFDLTARRIAHRLAGRGVKKGDFVLIVLPRNKEYVAAMYGIWLVGAAFVPQSTSYPKDRVEFIRENCGANVVVDEQFLRRLEEEEPLTEDVEVEDNNPSILIYTSGSTGKPKGVLHTFASINDSVIRYAMTQDVPVGFRASLGAPFTFVASVQGVFQPLYSLCTAYLTPYEAMRDPVLLAEFFAENDIERSFISPKILKVFKQKKKTLKEVSTGSERVSGIYTDEFRLMVRYGQTETAAAVMEFEVDREYENTPIGKPMHGVSVYLLDEENKPAEEGEICLAGRFASGYLGMEEQTAKTFIPNPFRDQDGYEVLLRTGDLGRRDENGNIIYINRKDWMVKINGQRVEPGEIETVIKKMNGIHDAVLKDFKNQYDQTYLVAYYVEKYPVDPKDIRASLEEQLPSYMVPSFCVRLDKLPTNANGKLDRGALLPPENSEFQNEYVEPETDVQRAICHAVEEILGVERVGLEDEFQSMGGDSITAAMVAAKLTAYRVRPADILLGKTPRAIEQRLLQAESKTRTREKKEVGSFPLTPAERSMYLEQEKDPSSVMYNLNLAFSLTGVDADQIEQALCKVFAAHEALHSFYGVEGGIPVRILSENLPGIERKEAESEDAVRKIVDSYAEPFILSNGIPVRTVIYALPDGKQVVHLAIHHIAFDGGSAGTFTKEFLAALKGGDVEKSRIDLSDLYEELSNPDVASGMEFYHKLFEGGVPVNDMPVRGGKRPVVHPVSDQEIPVSFLPEEVRLLDQAAKRYGISEFELIFSAIAMTVAKYCGSDDVVLGIPTNLRPADAPDVIGMFVNTAPVRVKVPREAMAAAFLKETGEAVREATYGSALPFEEVVAEFAKERDSSRNPIFDVSVNYMQTPEPFDQDGIRLEMYSPLQKMSRDVGIVIHKSSKGLGCIFQYSSELFEEQVIRNMIGQIRSVLRLLASGNELTLREALALPEDQKAVLEGFRRTGTADVPVTLLHKLFEETAKQNPDRTALIAVDGSFTYRELNERANLVAHHLTDRGVGVGDSVALLLPRESCFFACLLGVNKAGAAFIPCDPQYPADRIRHIIGDSEARYVVTTEDLIENYPAEQAIRVDELFLTPADPAKAEAAKENPDLIMSDDELSYMIYTSGSTGKPKGVMLHHKGICNYLQPHPANLHVKYVHDHIDTYLSVTTVSFDMSFKEHMVTLCNGKTLVFAGEEEMNDPRALAGLIEKHGCDCINATPSRLLQYIEYAPFGEALKNCKLIMSGGEGYPMSLAEKLRVLAPQARIINTYGPTEITVSCNGADITEAKSITVGKPLLNYSEVIVDKFGDLSPYGVTGELYVGGIGVARGYRNLEEMTQEKFVMKEGERMYRTGDLSRWTADGDVEILGRLDNQVKLRGLRIELGEIEGLMEQQPEIKKAVVVIRKIHGQDNLCAYFTAEKELDINELRGELRKHLTPYMVPTAYLQMEALPMTPNGKTDTKALPEPTEVAAGEYVAPVGEKEEFFCKLFADVLKLEKVGATDDFFEIGGTSLVVTSIAVQASEQGYTLNYGDVFKYTTPRQLAEFVSKGESAAPAGTDRSTDFDSYDYSKIEEVLARNNLTSYQRGKKREIGNILLTGAAGFMGAHVLAEYLTQETGTAYCIVRKGSYSDAKSRLQSIMFYYFSSSMKQLLDDRVVVLDGDVTSYDTFRALESQPIHTVFNCAANVKHFSSGTDIEDINVGGVENCITFCENRGARLIHFSTTSVGGGQIVQDKSELRVLDEQTLYFGQSLNNQYISSKMMAERVVLEAIAAGRVDAKVIRVGTLAPRDSDGEFQINYLSNSFMGRLRSYWMLGVFPYSGMDGVVRMGPIDTSASAFLHLARTPKECTVFNAINCNSTPMINIILEMNRVGMEIRLVENEEFRTILEKAEQDPEKVQVLQSLLAYQNKRVQKAAYTTEASCEYTNQVLAREGFFWKITDGPYIERFVSSLEMLGFFDEDALER